MNFALNLPKCVFQKHASTWTIAMVKKGGLGGCIEKEISVLKISSSKLSESVNCVVNLVLEIFEEMYLGTHCAPPLGWDRVKVGPEKNSGMQSCFSYISFLTWVQHQSLFGITESLC